MDDIESLKVRTQKVSRVGVYGVAKEQGKVLLITQKSGPFAGLFDLPGGGIEFEEAPHQTLHREFIEETGMDFKSMQQLGNFSAITHVPARTGRPEYTFHQIGLIYNVQDPYSIGLTGELKHQWIDITLLTKENTSPLAWKALNENPS